jgi:hypothetical protein
VDLAVTHEPRATFGGNFRVSDRTVTGKFQTASSWVLLYGSDQMCQGELLTHAVGRGRWSLLVVGKCFVYGFLMLGTEDEDCSGEQCGY